jgi:hypothetical protein
MFGGILEDKSLMRTFAGMSFPDDLTLGPETSDVLQNHATNANGRLEANPP